jgi:hypothetical protein
VIGGAQLYQAALLHPGSHTQIMHTKLP